MLWRVVHMEYPVAEGLSQNCYSGSMTLKNSVFHLQNISFTWPILFWVSGWFFFFFNYYLYPVLLPQHLHFLVSGHLLQGTLRQTYEQRNRVLKLSKRGDMCQTNAGSCTLHSHTVPLFFQFPHPHPTLSCFQSLF